MSRRVDFTQEERAEQTQRFAERLRDKKHSAFLLNMIESYFVKPKRHLMKEPGTKPIKQKKGSVNT
ncbi:hypothetical protein N7540_004920 [Penicillium herquei]|nr:hypothetical protein N7540_004920 [Penicillium herquei]